MSLINVAIVGATGETGSSIVDGLLESGAFVSQRKHVPAFCCRHDAGPPAHDANAQPTQHVKALVRPESLLKQRTLDLEKKGARVLPVDLTRSNSALLDALADVDTVIAAVGAFDYDVQYVLAEAAKKAGVKRFVPSSFTAVTPLGIATGRDYVS